MKVEDTNKCFKVYESTTVKKLRCMVAKEYQIRAKRVELMYKGTRLDDHTTMNELDCDDTTTCFEAKVYRWESVLIVFSL